MCTGCERSILKRISNLRHRLSGISGEYAQIQRCLCDSFLFQCGCSAVSPSPAEITEKVEPGETPTMFTFSAGLAKHIMPKKRENRANRFRIFIF